MQAILVSVREAQFGAFIKDAKGFGAQLFVSFRVHSLLFILAALYLIAVVLVQAQLGKPLTLDPYGALKVMFTFVIPLMMVGVLVLRFYHMVVYVRPEHPLPWLLKDIARFVSRRGRILNAIPITLVLIYFVDCFTIIKDAIPFVHAFSWDMTFMEIDRALHFGVDPWRLLQPVLGVWWMTLAINFVYNMWFFAIWFVLVAMVFAERQSALRLQYFVAFFLSWAVGGSLLAILFSSAGPVYFGRLDLGVDPYAPLMEYLKSSDQIVHIWALQTQEMLWDAYQNGNKDLVSGISAMPSVHNITAALLAIFGWRVSRFWGIAGTIFAALILIGSVHLGWHYAIDGYVGIALAGLFWWISGILVRWFLNLPMIRRDMESLQQV